MAYQPYLNPMPVSGTFWQATQPISGTVTVNVISGFLTETTFTARVPVNGQALMAASVPVVIASNQSAIPVTGTFWQATQPVSGTFWQATQPVSIAAVVAVSKSGTWPEESAAKGTTVAGSPTSENTDANTQSWHVRVTNPSLAVTGTFWQATQPVSGTFWQATQPVSGTVTVNVISGFLTETTFTARIPVNGQALMAASVPVVIASNQSAVPVSGTFWQATQPVSGTFWQATQPVSLTSTTITGTVAVTAPTITKGTQGTNGFTTQHLKDAGRNARSFMLDAYTAAPVAEALQSVVQWYNNAAVAGTTTPAVVPAGKTLRLISWSISTKSLATVGSAVMRIRANTAGVAAVGSPLVWSMEVGSRAGATTVAMTGGLDQQTGTFPEGFEFPAGTGIGFTLAGYGPTGTLTLQGVTRFQVYGYEY